MRGKPLLRGLALAVAPTLLGTGVALAQLGPRIIDTNRLDVQPAPPTTAKPVEVPEPGRVVAPPSPVSEDGLVLNSIKLEGSRNLPARLFQQAIAPFLGRPLKRDELPKVTTAVGDAYKEAGLALYAIFIPAQDVRNGMLRLGAIEGHVADIRIQGDVEGADLRQIRAMADRIMQEKPLRQATLERNILLMNDLPGRKVGSKFEIMSPEQGTVRLVLEVKRTSVSVGGNIDNLGSGDLGKMQASASLAVNSVLQEGDRTQVTYGAPFDFNRFTYLSGMHRMPIGTNGAFMSASLGYLKVRTTSDTINDGTAWNFGLRFAYPLIRQTRENLYLTAGVDALDSRASLLEVLQTSNEATRVVRLGASYNRVSQDDRFASSLSVVLSQGIDTLGARQKVDYFYGDPGFTKVNLTAAQNIGFFNQKLFLRLRGYAQLANERLPASEQFTYGGLTLGRGFEAGSIGGDKGYGGSVTLAVPLGFLGEGGIGRLLGKGEIYTFVDAARVINRSPFYKPQGDYGASAGFGINLPVLTDNFVQLEVAKPIRVPDLLPDDKDGWRFTVVLRREI